MSLECCKVIMLCSFMFFEVTAARKQQFEKLTNYSVALFITIFTILPDTVFNQLLIIQTGNNTSVLFNFVTSDQLDESWNTEHCFTTRIISVLGKTI